ncbi:unnamed protein product [marine sediment metagenome]|uniref:Uncharacterized protein n=1 Tax=marine sediment metagenome TaxID=412755 RepID=X0WKQ0_9ZZZZ
MSVAVFRPSGVQIVDTDTKANILASTPTANALSYATDTFEFYLWDLDNTEWRVAPLELQLMLSGVMDMGPGMPDLPGIIWNDRAGISENYITDKTLHNVRLLYSVLEEEGSIRTTTSGTFQVYLNSTWNDVVINFVLREDSSGDYEFEHKPVGFTLWIEIMSGNSDLLAINGLPIIQQYGASMGALPVPLQIDGRTF